MDTLEKAVKFLEWRRARLWKTVEALQSEDPWRSEKARGKIEKDVKDLEAAFSQIHRFLSVQKSFF